MFIIHMPVYIGLIYILVLAGVPPQKMQVVLDAYFVGVKIGFDYEVHVMPLDALRGALLYEANSHSKWTNRCLVSYSGCIARALLYEYVIRAHVSKIYVGVMNAS